MINRYPSPCSHCDIIVEPGEGTAVKARYRARIGPKGYSVARSRWRVHHNTIEDCREAERRLRADIKARRAPKRYRQLSYDGYMHRWRAFDHRRPRRMQTLWERNPIGALYLGLALFIAACWVLSLFRVI